MAKISDAENALSNWLTAEQVDVTGPQVVTIKALEIEEIKNFESGEMEEKGVLSFKETKKKLVVNGTRKNQLKDLFGADCDPAGKQVKLCAGKYRAANGRAFFQVGIEPAD